MAVGNREYFFRSKGLWQKTSAAEFPVLSANLRTPEGEPALQAWTILETPAGERVGVFGLTREMIPRGSWAERFSNLRFVPWEQASDEAVEILRPQVDWLVALTHQWEEEDTALAERHPRLDLILGGHTHPGSVQRRRVGEVTVITGPPYGSSLSLITSTSEHSPSEYEVISLTL
jgi:2',3'-cyclic-nucleotide 2'-phosphodiesterase (5'-nucleotidase family)